MVEVGALAVKEKEEDEEEAEDTLFAGMCQSWRRLAFDDNDDLRRHVVDVLRKIEAMRRTGRAIYPPAPALWRWTQDFDVDATRVVIIGQDPYHAAGLANGLAFAVPRPAAAVVGKNVKVPPTLRVILREVAADVDDFVDPGHGDLSAWAEQGVLLLNATLTVESGKANSHRHLGWSRLTDRIVRGVSDACAPGIVFMLWGASAATKAALIDGNKHHILTATHPSPINARPRHHASFVGCRHFSTANALLAKSGRSPVDWRLPP